MLSKEDVELIQRVSTKTEKRLIESIKNSELCARLVKLTRKDIQTIFVIGSKVNITMGEIAEAMVVNISTPTTTVDRLIKKGYVLRNVGEEDRRQVLVNLTPEGRELYDQLCALRLKHMEMVTNSLSEEEMEMFRIILRKLDQKL